MTIDFVGSVADYVNDLVLTQPDGKIVVIGLKVGGITDIVLSRYSADGVLDTTFGDDGVVITDFGINETVSELELDSQGNIIVCGSFGLARYDSEGNPDNSFGSDPATNRVVSPMGQIFAITVDSDNSIVVGGYVHLPGSGDALASHDFVIARYDFNGDLVATFGDGGRTAIDFGSTDTIRSIDLVRDIIIDGQGNIVTVGQTRKYDTVAEVWEPHYNAVLARLDADGVLDAGFGVGGLDGDGKVTTDSGDNNYAFSVALDADQKLVVGGANWLARYNTDGTPDTTFDAWDAVPNGSVDSVGFIYSLAVDSEGRIVLGGSSWLTRYNADGTPDEEFAPGGWIYTSLDGGYIVGNTTATGAIALDASDRIVVGGRTPPYGSTGTDFFIARYTTGALTVDVRNVAPTAVPITGPNAGVEGSTLTLSTSATDPAGDADPLSYSWTITRNGASYLEAAGQEISFTAHDDGVYRATVKVADGDGGYAYQSHNATIANVAPDFDAGPNETLLPDKQGGFDRTISFTDPGTDVWTGTVNFGDGTGDQPLVIDPVTKEFDLSHTYARVIPIRSP